MRQHITGSPCAVVSNEFARTLQECAIAAKLKRCIRIVRPQLRLLGPEPTGSNKYTDQRAAGCSSQNRVAICGGVEAEQETWPRACAHQLAVECICSGAGFVVDRHGTAKVIDTQVPNRNVVRANRVPNGLPGGD